MACVTAQGKDSDPQPNAGDNRMEKIFLRTPFNYDTEKASREAGLKCKDVTRTQQNFAEEADINTIVNRFLRTGVMPNSIDAPPQFADFEEVFDFQSAMNTIRAAQESFNALPARTRARFGNDPHEFVAFCSDENNAEEMIKMGLRVPPPTTAPDADVDPETGEVQLRLDNAAAPPQKAQKGQPKGKDTPPKTGEGVT